MKVLIIGGTGHIGSYLIPRLIRAGFDVQVIARNSKPRYTNPHLGWPAVQWILADREKEEEAGTWGDRMRSIETDVVIDLICYQTSQQQLMCEAFEGRIRQFLHCGTIWSYGPTHYAPYEESHPRRPLNSYGIKKMEIEKFLFDKYVTEGFPFTVIHPGHISGPGWFPIDPQGTFNGVDVYQKLATGEQVVLPDQGLATVHHVHADDVAQMFELAIHHRQRALGEAFSAVAPYAMSLRGCCQAVAGFFGREANLSYVPLSQIGEYMEKGPQEVVTENVLHSPCASIAKAQRLLGYAPRYTIEQIYAQCIETMLDSGKLVL